MASIFTRIINKEIPAHIIAENDEFLSFLDISPLVEGHALVIPKKEVDYIFDLDKETFLGLHEFTRGVARAIESVITCERIGVTVMGLEVPHAHVHLIPINTMDDMNFSKVKLSPDSSELAELAKKISAEYKAI
jgi:histidine triad (HIT) family protein